jgi:hypothetical protein
VARDRVEGAFGHLSRGSLGRGHLALLGAQDEARDGVVDPECEGRDRDVLLRVRDPTENEVSNPPLDVLAHPHIDHVGG